MTKMTIKEFENFEIIMYEDDDYTHYEVWNPETEIMIEDVDIKTINELEKNNELLLEW